MWSSYLWEYESGVLKQLFHSDQIGNFIQPINCVCWNTNTLLPSLMSDSNRQTPRNGIRSNKKPSINNNNNNNYNNININNKNGEGSVQMIACCAFGSNQNVSVLNLMGLAPFIPPTSHRVLPSSLLLLLALLSIPSSKVNLDHSYALNRTYQVQI